MNFFESISALNLKGDLRITIRTLMDNRMVVSVILVGSPSNPDAKKLTPLILTGTPIELEENFVQYLIAPIQSTKEFYSNAKSYLKELEGKKQKPVTPVIADPNEAKNQKYAALMKKASELAEAGKFRAAWVKVPEIEEFPEKEAEIRERREEYSQKFPPSLFS